MHATNAKFILGFIRFYVPCSSTLIMEEYKTLSCVHGYHEYQMAVVEKEFWCERERPRNPRDPYAVVVKKDGIHSAIAYSKFQKCSMLLIIHVKKFHVLNFCCLAEPRNFFTIKTFANYGILAIYPFTNIKICSSYL